MVLFFFSNDGDDFAGVLFPWEKNEEVEKNFFLWVKNCGVNMVNNCCL